MGLDMYLKADKSIYKDKEIKSFRRSLNLQYPELKGKTFTPDTVTIEIAYWRKANAIHAWFVKNIQDGKDECQRVNVSAQNLRNLVNICKDILSTPEPQKQAKALKLLPPQSGFFFGSLDLDDWYFDSLEDTVKMLEPYLNDEAFTWRFYYHSSW